MDCEFWYTVVDYIEHMYILAFAVKPEVLVNYGGNRLISPVPLLCEACTLFKSCVESSQQGKG